MSKETELKPYESITTTLGKETIFIGKLRFSQSLKIDGNFEGEIDATGFLMIAEGAVVKARKIRASSIVIGGEVRGDLEAADKLEMLPTAKVHGNVRTSKLRIADGVIFEGKCEMIRDPSSYNPFSSKLSEKQAAR
jgi:cytoskeletal protein CcmA (bactofilin family)